MYKSIIILFAIVFNFSINAELTPHPYFFYISHEHKLIYFAVPKTGFTSMLRTLNIPNLSYIKFEQIDLQQFKGYFKFAFVRNPWDRVVSAYENLIVTKRYPPMKFLQNKSFEYFVNYINALDVNNCDNHLMLQSSLIPEHIDFIGRFENFEEDLKIILLYLGMEKKEIPHLNLSQHAHYSHYYNARTYQIIANKYKKDIERFGYKFEQVYFSKSPQK